MLNENPMFLMMFRGLNINPDEVESIDWMIKAKFDSKEDVLKNKGVYITVDDRRYYFYLSTPSDMKNNKAIYVREDAIPLVKQYESMVSCGWIDSLEGQKSININKDVTARLSLFLSSSYHTSIQPNYLVLPEEEYRTIQSVKTFENDRLVVKENYEHTSVFADGCGVCSPELMRRVANELKINHLPCFIGVISIKLALKGLLVSVDFIKYFNDMYKGDTETLRTVNGYFEEKDVWGNWIKIHNNTIIVNPSMCKWANRISLEEYEAKRTKYLEDIMDALFITKTSKAKVTDIKKTSYQLLCQLALNADDYNELTRPSYSLLSGVLKGDKVSIYRFLGALSEESDNEDDIEITEKINYLLQIDFERFYKLPWIRRTLANMIERNVRELCSGKFFIKGDHKTICQEPLGTLNFVMNRKIDGTLQINEFWCNTDIKKVLACRFPIASFSEVGVMNFVENNLYQKYCNHWTKKLCVFNAKDIRTAILSGADFDTDTIFTTTNNIMIDAIIAPKDGLHFISTESNKSCLGELEYNWNERVAANTMYMGNIIEEVAILNACMSNVAQDLGAYVNERNITLKNGLLKDRLIEEISKEDIDYFWRWYLNQEKTMNLSREIVKEIITNQFYELEEVIYKTVEISMIAIDAPKTGVLPDLDFIKKLKKNYKKPYYFRHLPSKEISNYEIDFYNNSVLESYAKWNEASNDNWKGILARVEYYKSNSSWKNDDIFHHLFNRSNTFKVDEAEVEKVMKIIYESFQYYSKQRKERDKKYIVMKEKQIEGTDESYETDEPLLDANGNKIRVLIHSYEVRELMTKTMYFKAERTCIDIATDYDDEIVSNALFMLMNKKKNGIQRFVFDFYFKYIELMCSYQYSEYEALEKSDNPNALKILFNDYEISKRNLKTSSIGSKEIERFASKNDIQSSDIEFKFGCSKDIKADLNEYVTLQINEEADIYVISKTGEIIGKIYASGANNGVNLYRLVGAKLIIKEFKENIKSYTIWIKGIEV